MKKSILYSFILLFACFSTYAQKAKTPASKQIKLAKNSALKTFEDSVSYAYGSLMAADMQKKGVFFNPDIMAKGMKETASPQKLINETQARALMMQFQQKMMAKMQAEHDGLAKKNLEASNKFLATNKTKTGVTTTASGLQYEIIKKGDATKPLAKLTDSVTVHYEGKLLNGKVFDSSYKRGTPVTFPLNSIIPGWQEALQLMRPGDIFNLYIPANLAYGERGAGQEIGPNEVLIFKVELISCKEGVKEEVKATLPQNPEEKTPSKK